MSRELFAKRLSEAREAMGLTQAELAERIGGAVDDTAISRYEAGKSYPRMDRLSRIAEVLGLSRGYLAGHVADEPEISPTELISALSNAKEAYEKLGRVITSLEAIHLPPAPPKRSSRQSNKADEWRDLRPPDSPESTQSGDP